MSTAVVWGVLCRKLGLPKLMFIGAVLTPCGYITSFFARTLHQLMITIGIVSGIGTSILFVCSTTVVARVFEGQQSVVAMIVLNTASGVGTLGYPFLLDFFVNQYDISGTFLIIGGLNLNAIVVSMFMSYSNLIVKEIDDGENEVNSDTSTDKSIPEKCMSRILSSIEYSTSAVCQVINIRSGVVIITTGVSVGCLDGFLVVVLDFFAFKGFSVKEGLNSFLVFNICNLLGRLLPALFQLKQGRNPITMFILCPVCGCIGQIVTLVASDLWLVYLGRGLSGFALGGLISGSSVALLLCVEKERFNEAFGILTTVKGVMSCAMGPLHGWMRDELQSYDAVIALASSLLGVSGVFSLAALCRTKSDHNT